MVTAMLVAVITLAGLAALGHEPHVTSAIGERPALDGHVAQSDIETGALSPQQMLEAGARLFTAKFNKLDGAGRPGATGAGRPTARALGFSPEFIRTGGPDANSCAGCHFQPRVGGAGDFVANAFSITSDLDPVPDSIVPAFGSERNPPAIHGAGAIELLAREMTATLLAIRAAALAEARRANGAVTVPLEAKGVPFGEMTAHPDGSVDAGGVEGVDADLIVKPFGRKGVVVFLRDFTINAMNRHHGMQAVERFGALETGTDDFDGDGVPDELSVGDITAVTLWQAAQNIPGRVWAADPARRSVAERGEQRFSEVGCAACHRPALLLDDPVFTEPNSYNPVGTLRLSDVLQPVGFDLTRHGPGPRLERLPDGRAMVRAFTDLKRHRICDQEVPHFCNERLVQGQAPTDQFLTAKLWDVGNTAPYGHRGDLTTLTEAIVHHGGAARAARDQFVALPPQAQAEIIEFLKTLQIVPET